MLDSDDETGDRTYAPKATPPSSEGEDADDGSDSVIAIKETGKGKQRTNAVGHHSAWPVKHVVSDRDIFLEACWQQ